MKRRALAPSLALMLGIAVGAVGDRVITSRDRPDVRASLSVHKDAASRAAVSRVKAIRWTDEDGRVTVYSATGSGAAAGGGITLVGRAPKELRDDHGSTSFAVIDVTADNKAHVLVLSRFDHGTFGKNLVTVDCCVAEIGLKTAGP